MKILDCKSLAPIWETLANDFATEPGVLIAKVDAEAENSKALAQEQGVQSYPTIKFFEKGTTTPDNYEGARSEKDFLDYLNWRAGTHRLLGGALGDTGGIIKKFDAIIEKFQGAFGDGVEEATKIAADLKDDLKFKYAQYYVKVFQKTGANKEYAEKEFKRLQGMIGKGNLAQEKMDDLISRSNILKKFLPINEEKSEL